MPDNYPHAPAGNTGVAQQPQTAATSVTQDRTTFPYPADQTRILTYEFNERLFNGDHFNAFAIKIASENYGKDYAKMRYVVANFPGLISKIIADLLFIEPPKIQVPDGDQKFVDELISENKLRVQNYESALTNSYLGDTCYKIRIGKRNPSDKKSTVIIEEFTPKIYFPKVNPYNIKGQPEEVELAWLVKANGKEYLRKEIHTAGKIKNEVYEMEDNKIGAQLTDFSIIGLSDVKPEESTRIDRSLIVHIPNWRAGNRHFGISDYYDLETLFYAINNRITKVDNVLDKHTDPILALPDGILDENGKVDRAKLGVFGRPPDATKDSDPSYITWDANLESALKEVDKLVELTFMMSETAPDILGMGQGQSDSGRALKFKLLRTLAKAQRKQLYYREGLIEVIYTAQLLAKAWDLEVNGLKLTKKPAKPEIIWSDGLPADMTELVDIESKRIDAGLTTKVDSLMRLDDIDQDTAEQKAKDIKEENKLELPTSNVNANASGFGEDNPPKDGNPPVVPPVKPEPTK